MRTYINARLARVLMVGIFSLSWAFATADCTFGNFSASSNPFAGCSGKITITGTFSIDQDYNVSALPITELIIRGTLVFTANKDLILPTNTILRLEGGGSINTGSPCSNSKRIVIGSTVASCVGASSNFSFDQLNLTGWFSNLGPLPITLTNFEAKPGPSSVSLTWRTASELNNDYLIVERSANGTDFAALVRIKGLGTTDGPQDYQFSDHTPLAGINYYRLRQVDFDGTTEIHPTVSVLFNGETQLGLSAFPNPASSVLQVRWGGDAALETECRLFDLQGKLMFQSSFAPGTLTFDLPFQHLAPGAYALQMIQGAKVESLRVVKK
ncbi:MAG: T9SS type A sorting domain-containing protein [Haliscomenobacter sp.]|nr:T9SS type A sorting domain-containing protein [Haliscomenobacter sp.]MBP9077847.1 T9SS type A sorting domain-containing protein [Haliscomenobacter sp.]